MSTYVISFEEVNWGALLLAITMAIHGTSMFGILALYDSLKDRIERSESFLIGLCAVVVASLLIVLTNILEVIVWSGFYLLLGAQPSHSIAVYNALLNYTTLQAGYLPQRWHLLEPLLGMAGLLTVAWSTGILYMLAQGFQDGQLRIRKRRRERDAQASTAPRPVAPVEKANS